MALDQLIFDDVIVEAEEHHRAAQDELRGDVQRLVRGTDATTEGCARRLDGQRRDV